MNKETYLSTILELDKQMSEIRAKKDLIDNDYIKANSFFKEGDRIKITPQKGTVRFGVFNRYTIYYNGDIRPELFKEKKDGTKSMHKDWLYSNDSLELAK